MCIYNNSNFSDRYIDLYGICAVNSAHSVNYTFTTVHGSPEMFRTKVKSTTTTAPAWAWHYSESLKAEIASCDHRT